MKNNLSLIQPLEYNNLFSSYHNKAKLNRYTNYKLPQITNIFPSKEYREQSTNTFFNKNIKYKIKPINYVKVTDNKKQKEISYPLLSYSVDTESNHNKTNTDFVSNSLFHLYKTNHKIKKDIDKDIIKERMNNSHRLNVIYLNLFKSPIDNKNNNVLNLDSFYDFEINENNNESDIKNDNKNENDIISQKLKEINNKSIIKIKNIFYETDFGKLSNDFLNLNINNISRGFIDKFIEKILNNKNRTRQNNNREKNIDVSHLNGESFLVTNNVFLDWILDNVRRKIELKNEYNQHLTTVWVKNLICNEIIGLKNRFVEFRKSVKFSNFIKVMETKKINNLKKKLKKNDRSNFTSSTLRSYFDNSCIKGFLNNSNMNSNINSYKNLNNNSNEKSKNTITQNTTINDPTVGFDFYDNNTKKISNYNSKQIININSPYSTSNESLINRFKYLSFKKWNKNKNRTQLNNEYKQDEKMLFRNVYLNNPRSHKIKNFDIPTPTHIKSRIDFFHPQDTRQLVPLPLTEFHKKNKNIDIIDKIMKESINVSINKTLKFNYTPKKREISGKKRRNSFGFSYNEEKYSILKLITIKDNTKTLTPTKETKFKKENEIDLKPKFKNVILMNIDKLSYKRNKIDKNEDIKNFINNKDNIHKDSKNTKKSKKNKKLSKIRDNELKKSEKKKNNKNAKNITSQGIKKIKKNQQKNKNKKNKNKEQDKDSNQLILNSSNSSSSLLAEEEEGVEEEKKDTFFDIEEEMNKQIRKNLIVRRHKTLKPKLTLFQINSLKKILNKKNNNNDEEKDKSILSISSIDENEEIKENIELKKEIDIMSNILSNNQINNLFSSTMELKKYLRKRNKTDEIIEEIQIKKNEIKNILDIFFENLLLKSSIEKIKEEEEHIEIFNQLNRFKKFGVYSAKDLNEIFHKVMKIREKEILEYEKGYKQEEEDEEDENNIDKNFKKSSSIEQSFLRRRNSVIDNNNIKFEIKKGKRKKTNLIFNNSYLFKDNESDEDKKNDLLIKKEIQEILQTDYGNTPRKISDKGIFFSRRRKMHADAKKSYQKKSSNIKLMILNDELLDEELLLKYKKRDEEEEEQLKKEEIRDKKIYEFFSKIQKLKNKKFDNDEELDTFINQQIERNNEIGKDKNGGRLNVFLQEFHYNRKKAKYALDIRSKKIGFLSPIIFTSPNETFHKDSINNLK